MNMVQLQAFLPIIIIASISVLTMLLIAFHRHHRQTQLLSVIGYLAAFIVLISAPDSQMSQVTPLITMDAYSRFFIEMIILTSLCITLFSYHYLKQCQEEKEEYYILMSLGVLGASVLIASNNFASFFIGIELLSVSLFALVGYLVKGKTRRHGALEASIKYMLLSGVSSSFLLFGVALIYTDTGLLTFDKLQAVIALGHFGGYSKIGFTMVLIGLGFKVSWVPFHMWTPDVYEGAPAPVTTFLATVSKVAVFASILRFFIESGGYQFTALSHVLELIAVLSILAGNGLALLQTNLKRMLAYSSIAHMGYLLIALIAAGIIAKQGDNQLALEAVSFYLVAYLIMTLISFGIVTVLSRPSESSEAERLDQYQGLFWRRPWLAFALTLSLLSLAGIPFTIGFISKFYIVAAGVQHSLWVLLAALILGSAMGIYYYLGAIIRMSKPIPIEAVGKISDTGTISIESSVAIWILSILLIGFGLYPQPLINLIQNALIWSSYPHFY